MNIQKIQYYDCARSSVVSSKVTLKAIFWSANLSRVKRTAIGGVLLKLSSALTRFRQSVVALLH